MLLNWITICCPNSFVTVLFLFLFKGNITVLLIVNGLQFIVGGIPDINAAGKMVFKDWNRFVICYLLYNDKV